MKENLCTSLARQYDAAAAMMFAIVERCPAELWNADGERIPFWQLAYHNAFYLHFYTGESEEASAPAPFHRRMSNFLSQDPMSGSSEPMVLDGDPYPREDVLNYISSVRDVVAERLTSIGAEELNGPTPFPWLKGTRLEVLLYELRHLQHHIGQLNDRLRRHQINPVTWIAFTEWKRPPCGGLLL